MNRANTSFLAVAAALMLAPAASVRGQSETLSAADPPGEPIAPKQKLEFLVEIHRLPSFHLAVSPSVTPPPELGEEGYLNTAKVILASPAMLARVIDRLDLTRRHEGLTREALLKRLSHQIRANRWVGTSIVVIEVTTANLDEGRELARAVAEAYRDWRSNQYREHARMQLASLEREVRGQEDIVEEKRKLYHTIVKAIGFGAVEGQSIRDAIARRMQERRAEEGPDGEIDVILQSQDLLEAFDEYQAARDLLDELKQIHSRGRVAIQIPVEPITILDGE